jgi:hypothetical protein
VFTRFLVPLKRFPQTELQESPSDLLFDKL